MAKENTLHRTNFACDSRNCTIVRGQWRLTAADETVALLLAAKFTINQKFGTIATERLKQSMLRGRRGILRVSRTISNGFTCLIKHHGGIVFLTSPVAPSCPPDSADRIVQRFEKMQNSVLRMVSNEINMAHDSTTSQQPQIATYVRIDRAIQTGGARCRTSMHTKIKRRVR